MPWKPLPSVVFAIATYPFSASQPSDLPLQVGDHIYIIEQGGKSNEWYRGYLVAPPSLLAGLTSDRGQQLEHRVFSGIFPQNCVEVREVLGENQVNGKTSGNVVEPTTPKSPPAALKDGSLDDKEGRIERRRSQRAASRRLSRALSRKRSQKSLARRSRGQLLDSKEPMPRDPRAPKPMAPVPLLRVGDETGQSAEEPLVDEIAGCLREWHDARLHEVVLARGYDQLTRVQTLIHKVDVSRKQLMHDVMTMKELNTLREDTVWDLVAGNKLLNDEVIVRNPTERGRILTADDSVIDMTKLQANMSILDRPPKPPADKSLLHHILVDVRTLVCETEVPATLQVSICSKEGDEKPRPVTENYSIPVPLPDSSNAEPHDQPKTLFVNLSANDVGIGSPTTSLYLVFKLLKEEPVRTAKAHMTPHHQTNGSVATINGIPVKNSVRGRRSMFGSQRKSNERGHSRGASRAERPDTSYSTASAIDGRSSTSDSTGAPHSRETKMVKRTVGIGALDIGSFAKQEGYFDRRVTLWTPSPAHEMDASDQGESWDEIIRQLCRSRTGYQKLASVRRFEIFAMSFVSSDLDSLIRVTPTFLHEVHLTQKIGFSGAPTQKRSDIYLTLSEPSFPRMAQLSHSKYGQVPLSQRCSTSMGNLQLTLEVRKQDGERIDDCIFTSSNHAGHTAWRTTGIEIGEGWSQTIRLAIPPEDVPGSHIVMSIADSPSFPFALAWVPLWEDDAFLRDGEHTVALYVYDEYSSSMIGGKGAYLALPPWHKKADANAATVKIETYLCSTQYSQDPTLLGLLDWRSLHGQELTELLERFNFVAEIEIVKLLEEVFHSLFQILHEYSGSQIHEDLIFNNLVHVLDLARDRRFDLQNVIEVYAKTRFDWPEASQSLIKAWNRLLTNPLDAQASRKLRAALKVGDRMLRLIVETRKDKSEDGTPLLTEEKRESFIEELQGMFVALMALMRNPMAVLLGTQTLVVQHFHSWLPELADVMSPADIIEVATNLLDACAHAQGKMILYRLILIINCSNLDVVRHPDVQTLFVANTFRWLDPYWGAVTIEANDQWRAQVRLCCSVVAAQLVQLGEESCQYIPKLVESFHILQAAPQPNKSKFTMLFPTTYPFPSKRTPEEIQVDEAMLEISALLAAALTTEKRLYFDASVVDVPGVLLQTLKVGQSVLTCGAFPRSWMSLLVSHHRFAMTALERISEVLIDTLPDIYAPDAAEAFEFDTELWRAFFETLFVAASSSSLAMETFPEQKRRAIWKIAGDVREMGAKLLKKTWEAIGWETDEDSKALHGFDRMGGYQVQFVPELIGPVVELCLSVHASLRNVGIQVLRSMIISSWEIDQDLSVIQTAMIECLDKLCRTRKDITESVLQKAFVEELLDQFAPLQRTVEDSLYNAVVEMFGRIEELMGMLANVHSGVPTSSGGTATKEAAKIVETLRLMEFLKDVQSDDVYIRYVHQLAELQASAGFHTEAGLAVQLHADRYEWDGGTQLPEMKEPQFAGHSAFERREALYFEMIGHFERGQAWRKALDSYRELAAQYETNSFDFSKLARAQRAMAGIHERIARGQSKNSRYFRVLYRGLGFSPNLRDKDFIFEGFPNDRLVTFEERMQQMHPSAQLLRVGQEPSDVEGQYLQVFAVSLHKDLEHMVYQRTKVTQAVRDYFLLSSPCKFTTTTRQPARDVPITEQQVEKTVFTTAEAFPNILRRSEVVTTATMLLDPLHAAIDRTTRKTQELLALEKRVRSGEDSAMTHLSESLLLAVDPDSDSSVARYRSLLPESETDDAASVDADLSALEGVEATEPEPLNPMQNALKVALLDHALAVRRSLSLYKSSAHLATKAQLVPRFEATFARELHLLFPGRTNVLEDVEAGDDEWDDRDLEPDPRLPTPKQPEGDVGGRPPPTADDEGHESGTEKKAGRRRSLRLFRRNSSVSLKNQANGGDDAGRTGRASRQDRSRSRTRGNSLTRRISLFRSGSQKEDQMQQQRGRYTASRQSSSEDLHSGVEQGSMNPMLKQRLSFLNNREKPVYDAGAFV